MSSLQSRRISLALFCKVVDNYGDIGICWRLARQWHVEHGIAVTLWVDDLRSFQRLCPAIAPEAEVQGHEGVTVRHWRGQGGAFSPAEIADIVIEFFGCDIPPGYIDAMAQRDPKPAWINLEGLTAEEWVEGCHTLPSPHPRMPLTKHFFYPGFTARTGGLPHEAGLDQERLRFQSDPGAVADFLSRLGLTASEMASLKASLFCYPHAPLRELFEVWQQEERPLVCLLPAGVGGEPARDFLGGEAEAGRVVSRGALTLRVIPFLPQADYDKLLWTCDLNFVRGEDSFVRAQWADKPFVWHIYPQDKNLHHKKLQAFLQRYASGLEGLSAFSLAWNGAGNENFSGNASWKAWWSQFQDEMPRIGAKAIEWRRQMLDNGDLASNLLDFVRRQRPATS